VTTFRPWTKVACDECGCEFQVSRADSVERESPLLCEACGAWVDGWNEAQAEVTALRAQLAAVTDERDALAELPRVHPLLADYVRAAGATRTTDAIEAELFAWDVWEKWRDAGCPLLAPEGTTVDAEGRAMPVVDP
jgi:hypothetical protein